MKIIKVSNKIKSYFRFGDPKKVKRSKILNPFNSAISEEPMLYQGEVRDGDVHQQFEKGISSYLVLVEDPTIVKIPIGLRNFRGQLSGFLLNRLMENECYIFKGISIGYGTDGEPLVDSNSIYDVSKADLSNVYITDGEFKEKLLDFLDPRTIYNQHDCGFFEFFKNLSTGMDKDFLLNENQKYFDKLKSKFVTQDQINILNSIKIEWDSEIKKYE